MQGCFNCYFYLLFSPLILMGIFFKIMFEVCIFLIKFFFTAIVWFVAFILNLLGCFFNTNQGTTAYTHNNKSYSNKSKSNKKIRAASYEESKFERDADLWGLSKEDRRIAKEERMSPADFIEAEERDDDELVDDEW